MQFPKQFLFALIFGVILALWAQPAAADDAALNALYKSLLQREYAAPVIFPNHQVERKAQRSPSLRLRFGRRSDPDLVVQHTAEKRWFDEVNQKPIRSPSLRLRFGRRSDPSMPMHSPLDVIMNEAYDNQMEHDLYDNVIDDNDVAIANSEDDLYSSLMHSQKLRNLLLLLNKYGDKDNENLFARPAALPSSSTSAMEEDMDEFERAIRKPGPLRLRWGRSTGGLRSIATNGSQTKNDLDQKNKLSETSNEVEKSLNAQNKD